MKKKIKIYKQFPLGLNLDESELRKKKKEIAKALGQYDSEGNLIIYRELEEGEEIPEGQTIIFDPELIENQQNLTQIGIESEFQHIFKPCQDKVEYNRSIKLLDTSNFFRRSNKKINKYSICTSCV